MATTATGASAQGTEGPWWEAIPGFGRPESQPRRASDDDTRRRAEAIDDLRPDATPFRSELMIEALEAAIQRYQRIVANGGWPMIPGSRMIRPEDDDERMPALRQRLDQRELQGASNPTGLGSARTTSLCADSSQSGLRSRAASTSRRCWH
jgi:hypothetical protein